jgi:UDP:flavonoid glycosyltransferase YjiC (YdhE family)
MAAMPHTPRQEAPCRIAFAVEGSRGDCQPYCVLASALKKQGHIVLFTCCKDLVPFVNDLGVDARPCGYDAEKTINENEEMQEAMKQGDFFKFVAALNSQQFLDLYKEHVANYWRELDAFKPEVVLCGPLTWAMATMYQFKRGVPFMTCSLQPNLPTAHFAPFGLPSFPVWTCLNVSIWQMVFKDFFKSFVSKKKLSEEALGEDMGWSMDEAWFMDTIMDMDNVSLAPAVFGTSVNFSKKAPDWPDCCTLTGWWTMEPQEQHRQSITGSVHFGGGTHQALTQFLAAGEKPVYMGWGSMVAKSKEHMAGMAVRALMETGRRGIVLGGWAQLSLECLEDEGDWEELKEYCDENVLFVTSAPHAWLFPQCACIVHHGGSGTTAASVKSGVPTIITPVFLDQWDYAALVNEHQIGVGTGALVSVTVKKLAAAIEKCCEDEKIQENARKMAELVRKEDGIGKATKIITGFVRDNVRTGTFTAEFEEQKESYRPKPTSKRGCCAV